MLTYTPPVPLAPQIVITAMSVPLRGVSHHLLNVKQLSVVYRDLVRRPQVIPAWDHFEFLRLHASQSG
jgi:hypothetical protein